MDKRTNIINEAPIGAELRRRRLAKGLSQQALGAAAGVSFQQIQKYESGTNRLSITKLIELCRALDCSASDFVAAVEAVGAEGDA